MIVFIMNKGSIITMKYPFSDICFEFDDFPVDDEWIEPFQNDSINA